MMKNRLLLLLICSYFITNANAQKIRQSKTSFNSHWEFVKDADTTVGAASLANNKLIKWERVSLPHNPRIELIDNNNQWQGTCYYRKNFTIAVTDKAKHIALQFDAAMHDADIYLNGKHVFKHLGGYLPFYIDITNEVRFGTANTVVIKLNNQDNGDIPPGKPIKDLDFNYYGGIYRNAWLIIKEKVHITDAVAANREAGGGVLLHYENVSSEQATLLIKTEVQNDQPVNQNAQVQFILTDPTGREAARAITPQQTITNNNFNSYDQQLIIRKPSLWSPDNPFLYTLTVQVLQDGKLVDEEIIRTGIKFIRFEAGGFFLNGDPFFIRGTNRHQEYPYIGYALSDQAQYRDAWKIKSAGFNFVRCSHYPPAPAFLDACDELGIMVMNSIPGWQFFGKANFQQNSLQDIRDMIHRDRNRPSIILWEASLNETNMSREYMKQSHEIVHTELPFAGVYTCGWMDAVYDVFIPARQHAKAPDYWKRYTKRPLLIAEYGDWEYYAQNAGFNQKEYKDLEKEERTSRQLRGAGEKALLQQALNYQESHNDNRNGNPAGDANWLMFDYKRGYAPDIESSGIMDINRLPKFSFYFYQSQYRKPGNVKSDFGKPMIFIAGYWNDTATKTVKVYSNCDEVELLLNGKKIARQQPDKAPFSNKLLHPPFTFTVSKFKPGKLTAIGYNNGKEVAKHVQQTPGKPAGIIVSMDESGKKLQTGKADIVLVYAKIVDSNGTLVPGATNSIRFTLKGNAEIIGVNPAPAEAGIATVLLKVSEATKLISISASAENIKAGQVILQPVPVNKK